MTQMSGMMQQFSVQVLDLMALVSVEHSSSLGPEASSMETLVAMVRPEPRPTASSIET